MSYLLDFVKTFTAEEMKQFLQLDLIGKEEQVRDEYAKHYTDKKFDETKLPERLQLSQSHADKINSVLLDKIVGRLYGNDYSLILSSILTKGLSDLMWHELKIIQRKVLKLKDATQHTVFYKAAFDTLMRMYHPHYNSKFTHEYGKKYLNSLGSKKTIEDEAYIALFAHYGDMIAEFFAGNELTYKEQAWSVLKKWQARLKQINKPDVDAYYYFVLGNYYKYYGDSASDFTETYLREIEVLAKARPETNKLLYGRSLCEVGFGYMEGSVYDKAQAYYDKAFKLNDDFFAKHYYHAGNYFFACLCNANPQSARYVFETFLRPYLSTGVNSSLRFDILQSQFILQLHLNDYENAFAVLNELRSFKKNEITRLGNVMVRFSETLYYFLCRNYKVAAAMAEKNLKFLSRSENQGPQFVYYQQYIDCIDKVIKNKNGTLRFPDKLDAQIASLRKGIYTTYNCFLSDK